MVRNMSAVISALGALLQATAPYSSNTSTSTSSSTSTTAAFFHDLLQLYIPVGGHIELRAPTGHIPQVVLTAVHHTQRGTIIVSVGDLRNPIPNKKLQVLFIESDDALLRMNQVSRVGLTPLSDSHVVMLLPPGYSSAKVLTALSLCWRASFATCLAAVQPDEAVHGVYDFYYAPLELSAEKRCTSQHGPPARVNRWMHGNGFEKAEATTQERISDYQGCHVLVAANLVQPYFFHYFWRRRRGPPTGLETLDHFGGLDVSILKILAEKYNFSVLVLSREMLRERVQNSNEEEGGEGGNGGNGGNGDEDVANFAVDVSGAFIAVQHNDADVIAGGFVPTEWRFNRMHVTRSYARDVLRWYIRADEEDSWVRLTMCFSKRVWVALGVAFCAAAAVRLLIAPKHVDPFPILTLWGITTESRGHPRYGSAPELILGVAWIVFCLHINSWYRAGLAMSLAAGPLYEDMTDRELYRSDVALLLPVALDGIVGELLHEHRGRRYHCASDKDDCMNALRRRQRSALLTNSNMMMVEAQMRLMDRRTGLSLVRGVPGRVLTYPIQMYMARGHLLAPTFNELLQWLSDGGFPNRYMRDLLWRLSRRRRRRRVDVDAPLTLGHLAGAFALLFSGLAVACLVAVVEACTGKGCCTRMCIDVRQCCRFLKGSR